MPIYEYMCDKCGREFEELVFDDAPPSCPQCGAARTRKLMSRPCRHSGGDGDDASARGAAGGGGCAGCSGGDCAACR